VNPVVLFFLVIGLALIGWLVARARASGLEGANGRRPHSLPGQHGWYVAIWIALPALAFLGVWAAIMPTLVADAVTAHPAAAALPAQGFERASILAEARALATGNAYGAFNPLADTLAPIYAAAADRYGWIGTAIALLLAFAGGAYAYTRIRADLRARTMVERVVMMVLLVASLIAILTTLGIFLSLLFESARFFAIVPVTDFLFGTRWNPQVIGATNPGETLGAVPLFWGTFFIGAVIAMIVAIPFGLMSAIYLTQYAAPAVRKWMKPILEILAGVPTVVYGYFAALGLWLFRRADRRSGDPRPRRHPGLYLCQQRKRAGGGAGDGHHDHPVRVLHGR
jgi:phosphate transport system permease protein